MMHPLQTWEARGRERTLILKKGLKHIFPLSEDPTPKSNAYILKKLFKPVVASVSTRSNLKKSGIRIKNKLAKLHYETEWD